MSMEQQIRQKLEQELHPSQLEVINQSHLHKGHAGDDGSGESHFRIEIAAKAFEEISPVARERLVHKALAEEMPLIHALSIKIISS